MCEVLGYQLKQLESILLKNNIEYYSSTIQGVPLEFTHIIKIDFVEDNLDRNFNKREEGEIRKGHFSFSKIKGLWQRF